MAHHVARRGDRRQPVFFGDEDDRAWRALLAEGRAVPGVTVWGYRLMPDHVHPVMVPASADGPRAALGEAHLMAAARYVELDPARARLAAKAEDWAWSSARAHLESRDEHQAPRAGGPTGRPLGSEAFAASLVCSESRPCRHLPSTNAAA